MVHLTRQRRKEILTLVVVFLGVLLISAFVVYFLSRTRTQPEPRATTTPATQPTPGAQSPAPVAPPPEDGFFSELFGPSTGAQIPAGSWGEVIAAISLRLLLASLLGAALALRPRRRVLAIKRNPYVGQTQILLSVVAAALMMVVGDSAARAFGIFAAASLVRFRTNIRDPKEITVLLLCLAVGLASGVGRWDLGLVLCLFSLLLLWVLEYREPEQVFRSMDLSIGTRNVAVTHDVLRDVFERRGFDSELRGIKRDGEEDSPGNIMYSIDLEPTVTTDEVSEEILHKDPTNIESIEWEQKKSFSYLYQ
jgi:uncharacterized membrane protein YhiD involved in acid resistance